MAAHDRDLIYGRHAVLAVLRSRPGDVRELWLQEGRKDDSLEALANRARESGVSVQSADAAALRHRTRGAVHQGIVARVRPRALGSESDLSALLQENPESARLLILDGVTDPRNLGACLRVAEAAGAQAVIVPGHRQARLTGSACKSASGSAERVPLIQTSNLARSLQQIKEAGVWLYAAGPDSGTDLWQTEFRLPWGIVLGGEGKGVRPRTRTLCDFSVHIPMRGEVASLNVAVASGVLLFEAERQGQVEPGN